MSRQHVVGAPRARRGSAPMNEPRTVRVKNGGSVSLERGPDEKAWTRLEVATADRTVALGIILTADEAGALGLQLLRLAGGPEPFGWAGSAALAPADSGRDNTEGRSLASQSWPSGRVRSIG